MKKAYFPTAVNFLLLISITLIACYFSCIHFLKQFPIPGQDRGMPENVREPQPVTCDRSHDRYDICLINGPAVLDPIHATVYSIGPKSPNENVKPYPRKWEHKLMSRIKEVKIKTGPIGPICAVQHNSPGLIFSAGGLTGNFYHDTSDGFLALYITLNSISMTDRDVILVVDNASSWWLHKYADIIRGFTKHAIINLDNETSTHCFTRLVVGLISQGEMTLDPRSLPSPLTLAHFQAFLKNIFDSRETGPTWPNTRSQRRPKLVWVDRVLSDGRVFLSPEKARSVAEDVGFEVLVYKPTKRTLLRDAYTLINASHALIGVHGAALTHFLFLRLGSVFMQVVPLGLELLGEACFGRVAREVGMSYMEYKIKYEESSLSSEYKEVDPIIRDAKVVMDEELWDQELMDVYLKEQNVDLDLVRFRSYMEKAYKKAKRFMELHG